MPDKWCLSYHESLIHTLPEDPLLHLGENGGGVNNMAPSI